MLATRFRCALRAGILRLFLIKPFAFPEVEEYDCATNTSLPASALQMQGSPNRKLVLPAKVSLRVREVFEVPFERLRTAGKFCGSFCVQEGNSEAEFTKKDS